MYEMNKQTKLALDCKARVPNQMNKVKLVG